MTLTIDLIRKILKRNNFEISESDVIYVISQVKSNSRIVEIYYFASIFVTIIGILIMYYGLILPGIVFILIALMILKSISSQKEREKSNFGIQINISSSQIELIKNNASLPIDKTTIEKIDYQVEKNDNISTGTVQLFTKTNETFPILEIFGNNKRYVEGDIKVISRFFAEQI